MLMIITHAHNIGDCSRACPLTLGVMAVTNMQADAFGEAWRLATVNRVDLNVLVDYAWPRFLEHGAQFVAAVGDDQAVCDLLAALKEGSVTAAGGLYARALPDPPAAQVRHHPLTWCASMQSTCAAVTQDSDPPSSITFILSTSVSWWQNLMFWVHTVLTHQCRGLRKLQRCLGKAALRLQ